MAERGVKVSRSKGRFDGIEDPEKKKMDLDPADVLFKNTNCLDADEEGRNLYFRKADSFICITGLLRGEPNQKLANEATKEFYEILKYESCAIPQTTMKRIDPEKEWDDNQRKEFPNLFDLILHAYKTKEKNTQLALQEMKVLLDKRKAALILQQQAQTKSYPTQQIPIIENKWAFCDICGTEGSMDWKCIQCMQIMCDRCKMAHGNARASMNHFIFHKSDQSKEAFWIKVYKCRDHREKNVSLFCMDDKRCICQICHIKSHKGHEVIEYEDYADMVRQRIDKSIEEADNLQRAASAISTEATTFSSMLDDEKQKLQEISKKHHAISDAIRNDLQSLKVMKKRRDAEVIYREEETASFTAKMKSKWGMGKERLLSSATELERIRNRLGKVEGWKSMEGNPEITEFIQFAKPTSIAEKFSELYDNEWTDAYAEKCGDDDEVAILELLTILERSYKFCKQQSKELHEHLNSTFEQKVQSESQRKVQTIMFAVSRLSNIQEEFCKTEQITTSSGVQSYARRCVAICLIMNIQSPPMVMDAMTPTNNLFDSEKFKFFTRHGKYFDYMVWPALYVYEGGPLISKGFAQPK